MTKWKLISMIFMTTRLVNSTREAGTTHIYNCEKYGTCKKSRSQAASAANTSKEYHYTTQYGETKPNPLIRHTVKIRKFVSWSGSVVVC